MSNSSKKYRPRVPKGLESPGSDLWIKIVEAYELEDHALSVLEQLCRTQTRIAQLDAIVDAEGLIIDSPQGRKTHPALVEVRQLRTVYYRLHGALGFPEVD
ncbi:terminase [Brevibacterium sediminis]